MRILNRGTTNAELFPEVEKLRGDRTQDLSLIVRPGLIVGPRDPTGRFTYWEREAELLAAWHERT